MPVAEDISHFATQLFAPGTHVIDVRAVEQVTRRRKGRLDAVATAVRSVRYKDIVRVQTDNSSLTPAIQAVLESGAPAT